MRVAVVLVGFRNSNDVRRCLSAIARSTYKLFEIIICENGGRAAFEELSTSLPERLPGGQPVAVISTGENLGYAGGVNLAMAHASDADAWWILNPDTEPSPQAMALYVERLGRADCDAVSSTIYLPTGVIQSRGGLWRPWLARAVSLGHGENMSEVDNPHLIESRQNFLNGASMMVSRRFNEIVGPMREDYFLYCEEVEWCLRAIRRGLKLGYVSNAPILHYAGTTTGSYAEIRGRPKLPIYLNERNKVLLTRDLFPQRLLFAAIAALGLAVLKFGRAGAWRQLAYAASGWMSGMTNSRGRPSVPGGSDGR